MSHTYSAANIQLVQTIMSKSYLTEQHLKGEERVKFESGLRDVIGNLEKTWIDEKVRIAADKC